MVHFISGVLLAGSDLVPEPRGLPEARAQPGVREHEATAAGERGGRPGRPVRLPDAILDDEHLRAQRRGQRRRQRQGEGGRGTRGAVVPGAGLQQIRLQNLERER